MERAVSIKQQHSLSVGIGSEELFIITKIALFKERNVKMSLIL
jgi:hypothetical protein